MVLIIGAGYIGEAVGNELSKDHTVVLTTHSQKRVEELIQRFPFVHPLDVDNLPILHELVQDQDIIVLTLAARSKDDYENTYLKAALHLKEVLNDNKSVKQILYTSSSSVYGECQGELVLEQMPTKPLTPQSLVLKETEDVLLSLQTSTRNVCIFRLSEIYGPGREISQRVRSYIGKAAPGDGLNPTNMIHQTDIKNAIVYAIKHHLKGIYNLCDDDHMSRSELYTTISKKFSLPFVAWDPNAVSMHQGSKILSNQKIKASGFCFTYPKRELI